MPQPGTTYPPPVDILNGGHTPDPAPYLDRGIVGMNVGRLVGPGVGLGEGRAVGWRLGPTQSGVTVTYKFPAQPLYRHPPFTVYTWQPPLTATGTL